MNTATITLKAFNAALTAIGDDITISNVVSALNTVSRETTSSEFHEFVEYAVSEMREIEDAYDTVESMEREVLNLVIESETGLRYGNNEIDDEFIEEAMFTERESSQSSIDDMLKVIA